MIPLLTEVLGLAAAGVVLVGAMPFFKKSTDVEMFKNPSVGNANAGIFRSVK